MCASAALAVEPLVSLMTYRELLRVLGAVYFKAISDVAVRSRVYSFGFAQGVVTVWNGMTNLTIVPPIGLFSKVMRSVMGFNERLQIAIPRPLPEPGSVTL